MKLRYPATIEAEIKNLIHLYLEPVFNKQSNDIGDFF